MTTKIQVGTERLEAAECVGDKHYCRRDLVAVAMLEPCCAYWTRGRFWRIVVVHVRGTRSVTFEALRYQSEQRGPSKV